MLAGVFVIMMAMRQRSQQLEMQHRERMAMIERGLVPIDPARIAHRLSSGGRSDSAARSMSLGIIVIAVGLGLMTIVSIAGGSPQAGVGVGGAIVILASPLSPTALSAGAPSRTPLPPPARTTSVRASKTEHLLSRLHTTIKRCWLSNR